MEIQKNVWFYDRLFKWFMSELTFFLGYFWASWYWKILFFAISLIALSVALSGRCPIYNFLGWKPKNDIKPSKNKIKIIFAVYIIVFLLVFYLLYH